MKQALDVYVSWCEGGHSTHPFTVQIRWAEDGRSQAVQVTSLRDALICGNGMIAALMAADVPIAACNVVFDSRFDR